MKKKYRIFFTPSAQKDYEKLRDAKLVRGVNRIIEKLKEDPFRFKKLSGPLAHLRSAKTFSFRVLYQIENDLLVIYVISIENRRDAYR